MEEVEIKIRIPKKLYTFVNKLLDLYKKDETEFWREELMTGLYCLMDFDIPFITHLNKLEVNELEQIFDC